MRWLQTFDDCHPLPRRVRHKERETALSLALRLAHRHGEGWSSFASATRLPVSGLRLSEGLGRLAALSSIPAENLEPWTPKWFGHEMEVLGHRLDRSRFLRVNIRLCPECMREDVERRGSGENREDAAYLRVEWMLAFVFGCPEHGRALIARCQDCGSRPKWNVGRIDRCHCGARLLSQQPRQLSSDELGMLQFILDRAFSRDWQFPLPRELDQFSLGDTVKVLRLLGDLAVGGRASRSEATSLEIEDLGSVLVAGAEVLSDLPRSFEGVLDKCIRTDRNSLAAIERAYGIPLVRLMRSDLPLVDALRGTFDSHSKAKGVRWSPLMKSFGGSFIGMAEKPDEALTAEELKRLRAALDWEVRANLSRAQVLKAERGKGTLLRLMDAAAHLGVSRANFARLRDSKMVCPIWDRNGGPNQFFYKSELDDLLGALRGTAPEVPRPSREYRRIDAQAKALKTDTVGIVERLLDGSLSCAGVLPGLSGVQALLFGASVRPSFRSDPPGMVSGNRVQFLLGVGAVDLKRIRQVGLLPALPKDNAILTPLQCLRNFAEEFVPMRHIVLATGLTRPRLRAQFARSAIERVPNLGATELYSRSEVRACLGPLPDWLLPSEK